MDDEEEKHPQTLAQFLSEEKNFETLQSCPDYKQTEGQQNTIDFNFNSEKGDNSPRISELKPENIQNRYSTENRENAERQAKINEEMFKKRLEEERDQINQEWEYKFIEKIREYEKTVNALEKENKEYQKDSSEKEKIKEELNQMRQVKEQFMEKYENQLQENINRIKREEEERKNTPPPSQSEFNDFKSFAEKNIVNPMDLSMSIVVKEGMKLPNVGDSATMVPNDKLHQLDSIFERQKAITHDGDDSNSDEESTNKETVFRFAGIFN